MPRKKEAPKIVEPTDKQIENCYRMGWIYLRDGIFENKTNGWLGYFTESGFKKE